MLATVSASRLVAATMPIAPTANSAAPSTRKGRRRPARAVVRSLSRPSAGKATRENTEPTPTAIDRIVAACSASICAAFSDSVSTAGTRLAMPAPIEAKPRENRNPRPGPDRPRGASRLSAAGAAEAGRSCRPASTSWSAPWVRGGWAGAGIRAGRFPAWDGRWPVGRGRRLCALVRRPRGLRRTGRWDNDAVGVTPQSPALPLNGNASPSEIGWLCPVVTPHGGAPGSLTCREPGGLLAGSGAPRVVGPTGGERVGGQGRDGAADGDQAEGNGGATAEPDERGGEAAEREAGDTEERGGRAGHVGVAGQHERRGGRGGHLDAADHRGQRDDDGDQRQVQRRGGEQPAGAERAHPQPDDQRALLR